MYIFRLDLRNAFLFFIFLLAILSPFKVFAGQLTYVSDTISTSDPFASTTHTIAFTTTNAIPPSGRIVVTPEGNAGSFFDVPATLNFQDIALSVSSGGPFISRTLASAQSVTEDGVSIVSGNSGSITILLASGVAGINTTDIVQLRIGSTTYIVSPSAQNSYRIRIGTYDASNTLLDSGTAMVAFITPVDVTNAAGNTVPPVRSNGLPTGLLPGSTVNVLVSFNTDVPALCKYATSTPVDFFAMASSTIFTTANNSTLHYVNISVAENQIFSFYIRCANESLITNSDDYLITFEVGVIPNASSTPTPPAPPPGPSGPGPGGGWFTKGGDVTLEGRTLPQGSLVILQDGKIVKEEQVSILGNFTNVFTQLERGTYTWGVYVKDPDGNRSATYNSTIYLIGGTNNIIAPIYLSPTIKAQKTTVSVGEQIVLSGYAIPVTPILAFFYKQGSALTGKIITATTTALGSGSWSLKIPTQDLVKGTYEVKVQSLVTTKDQSNFSPILYIGVGENPNPDFKLRADLNKDGKVNLIDFSILLFNWKTSDAIADINQDGTVSLIDFSIMLANWTG